MRKSSRSAMISVANGNVKKYCKRNTIRNIPNIHPINTDGKNARAIRKIMVKNRSCDASMYGRGILKNITVSSRPIAKSAYIASPLI
jgi:hypothetical protein